MQRIIILLFISIFVGCSENADIGNRKYTFSSSNKEYIQLLEKELQSKRIPYEKSIGEGGIYRISYSKEVLFEVSKIIDKIIKPHNPYTNTKSLCSDKKERQENIKKLLTEHGITNTTDKFDQYYCNYWQSKDDSRVKEILPIYQELKRVCKSDP
ncbi:MAG TPA: hypothetical protein ENJ28_01835 [Gammaproteobacteria bacterium]|nr:hypothetical protein [Gammaproteobacteria bacterium]